MLEKQANPLTFLAQYIASKVGATGLTVTVDVWKIQQNGTAAEIVTAGSATEVGDGLYRYILAAVSVDANAEYVAVFKTANTSVDQQHLAGVYSVGRAGVANLDAAISTRATPAEVNTQVDTALADYDGPTKAELDAAQASIEAGIDGLENLSAAEVNAEVDAALAEYDSPTDAELDTATAAILAAIEGLEDPNAAATAAAVWAYAVRTLTQGAASVEAAVTGANVTVYRGTTWIVPLSGLGDLSLYNKIYVSVKKDENDSDDNAILRVYNDASGLERVNKAAPTAPTNGIVIIDDVEEGNIRVVVQEQETKNMPVQALLHYDVKGIDNDGNVDMKSASGKWTIAADITRKIS